MCILRLLRIPSMWDKKSIGFHVSICIESLVLICELVLLNVPADCNQCRIL